MRWLERDASGQTYIGTVYNLYDVYVIEYGEKFGLIQYGPAYSDCLSSESAKYLTSRSVIKTEHRDALFMMLCMNGVNE